MVAGEGQGEGKIKEPIFDFPLLTGIQKFNDKEIFYVLIGLTSEENINGTNFLYTLYHLIQHHQKGQQAIIGEWITWSENIVNCQLTVDVFSGYTTIPYKAKDALQ